MFWLAEQTATKLIVAAALAALVEPLSLAIEVSAPIKAIGPDTSADVLSSFHIVPKRGSVNCQQAVVGQRPLLASLSQSRPGH